MIHNIIHKFHIHNDLSSIKGENSLIKSSNSKNSIEYCVIQSCGVHLFICYTNLGMIHNYRISSNKLDLDYINIYGNNHTYQ